ncbi:MAG: DUF2249 domain-containing protein [Tepidiformaceae bacterium]
MSVVHELDNRGLGPPEPMVRILRVLGTMEDGDALRALMDREPRMLYPELERRGFAWEFSGDDGEFVLTVRHAAK